MQIRIATVLVSLSLVLSACTPTQTTSVQAAGVQRLSFGESIDIAAAGARLSALRAQNGLGRPLGHSAQLQAAAQAHADDMSRTGNFSHTGSNGSNVASRIRSAGYRACFYAENIAQGQASTAQVFQDFMASPGHRRNMVAAQATQFGFAETNGYWVLVLGRSC